MTIRLIGDLHGDWFAINDLKTDYTQFDLNIQLGDFGIGFGGENCLNEFDSNCFKVLFGNHDNYQLLKTFPHNLGRFGILEIGDKKIFYIGGARSVDVKDRILGLSWWNDEELSYKECSDCLDLYEENCVYIDTIISHDCPINVGQNILRFFPNENITNKLLYEIWKIKEPSEWFFGHHHRNFKKKIGDTNFHCLNINEEFVFKV